MDKLFEGSIWNFTQTISHVHWMVWWFHNVYIVTALKFKGPRVFLKHSLLFTNNYVDKEIASSMSRFLFLEIFMRGVGCLVLRRGIGLGGYKMYGSLGSWFHVGYVYWTKKKKRTFCNGLTFYITKHWGAPKWTSSQEALFISSTLIVYALDHIGTARQGLRKLHETDSVWDIFTCVVWLNHASERL